jgi:hypothetical protein
MGMHRAATLMIALALAGAAVAQTPGQGPAQPSQSQAGADQSNGRPPVQAKSPAEFQAYQAAVANAQNPEAMEKAADEFAATAMFAFCCIGQQCIAIRRPEIRKKCSPWV